MYDFIFYYLYKLTDRKNTDAFFNASTIISFILVVHIALPLSIIKKVFDLSYSEYAFSDKYLINKLYMMPFAIILMILVYNIFKRRFNKIERKYDGKKMVTFLNTMIVFSLMLVPLLITIFLLQ